MLNIGVYLYRYKRHIVVLSPASLLHRVLRSHRAVYRGDVQCLLELAYEKIYRGRLI